MKCFLKLLLYFIIAYVNNLNAQSVKDFNIYNFTNDNGLPQNSIKSIALDKDKYLWIATESGLVRYDGKNFRVYNRENLRDMHSSRISYVGLMPNKSIYFIDENSFIYTQNIDGQFERLKQRANSELLICTTRGFYNPSSSLGIAGYNYLNSRLISDWINSIMFYSTTDSSSGFIAINKNTIAFVSRKHLHWIDSVKEVNKHVLRGAGTLEKHFYYLDLSYRINTLDSQGKVHSVHVQGLLPSRAPGPPRPSRYALLQQEERLHLLYDNRIYRLSYLDDCTLKATLLVDANDIPNITSFGDYAYLNTMIIGSGTKGLFVLKKKQFTTVSFPETDNIFYAQAAYGDSGILTHFGLVTPQTTKKLPIDKIKRQALLRDKAGNYWMNRGPDAVIKISPDFSILREIRLREIYVNCFAETPDGNIWLASNKNKLGRIAGDKIEWLSLMKLGPNAMATLLPVDNEHFWVGGNQHLFTINVRTGRVVHYNYFKDCDVRCLQLDDHNRLWIGTYGKGYFVLSGNKLTRMPIDSRGYLMFVHTILEDRRGNVWMTTNNGIMRTRKSDLEAYVQNPARSVYYQYYTKEQGFNTNEFNGGCTPAALELRDGKLSFPSMDGLVQFYPDSLQEAYPTAKILIDDVLVDGKSIPLKKVVILPPSFNRLEIQVSSPYYDNPANQQIEYKLSDFEDRWYPLSNNNSLVYNRLPYGNYKLKLRKRAGFATDYYITAELQLVVKPFLYQEWYFKAFAALFIILLVLLFFRFRYFYLIKKQRRLEHKVQQRTRELVYNNRLKEKLTLLIAHDLQSPLHFLTILARHVHRAAQNNDIESVLEGSEEIKNTTAKIYSFVKEFSLWNMSLNDNYRLNKTSFPINALLEELSQFFEEMLRLKNNRIEIRYTRNASVNTDRDVLKAILRNIIDNANKYTQNGSILINVHCDENNAMALSVSDTGNGMTEQQLEKINYRIRQSPSIPAIEKDGRLGFQLIIDFAARLGARLSVNSTFGQGTTITISGFTCED
ncbi:ligand-binding sensor domain-containing protein [Taibaiella koreensis]|uniref:ligand-binding sensor domain-containing protein n=1 Tax=Taibaiella koreensis TaxID=1268548 RepID=UPI000E59A78A|nr:two-component regulator propeller domain-containing protein [Taibaiella koreensis]